MSWISRWWQGHRRGRRPVSRTRHALGLSCLGLIVVALIAYRHLTSEARLRHFAEQWLADFSGGEVRIERVQFNLFRSLHLIGVRIATPASADFYPASASFDDRLIFSASTVLFRLEPFSIISGELVVPEIVSENPKLTLVDRVSDGKGNWELMLRKRSNKPGGEGKMRLPAIRLRNVEVQQYQLSERGRSGGTLQTFYAGAQPRPDQPEVYHLSMTKLVPMSQPDDWTGEAGSLEINMETLALSGSLPSLSMEELLFAAPPEIRRWLDILSLQGYMRADTFQFDRSHNSRALLRLRDAGLSVPIDPIEMQDARQPRYILFSNVEGTIQFEGDHADVSLEGLFRHSPIKLQGRLTLSSRTGEGFLGIGFDLDLAASHVPLPRNDPDTSPAEKRFVNRWRKLRGFVYDFDGTGPVDLTLKLHKEPGTEKGIEFVEGTLTARGVDATYRAFPYRLHDLHGEVRFRRDGKVDLVDLAGTHGRGKVLINGQLGGYFKRDSAALQVAGRDIAIDDDLLRCLKPRDRELCESFITSARADMDIQLSRPAEDPNVPDRRWTSDIGVRFLDGTVRYAAFPYPLEQLTGHVRIAGGTLTLDALRARRGDASVEVSGTAQRSPEGTGTVDLDLSASRVPLDEVLSAALPAHVRAIYDRCAPTGRMDLKGRLLATRPGEPLGFDLAARLSDGSLLLPIGGIRLQSVAGDVRILPDKLELSPLRGGLGESEIEINGILPLGQAAAPADLQVHSDALRLDDTLRAALPPAWQSLYDALSPKGRVRLDLALQGAIPTSAPASAPETVVTAPAETASSPASGQPNLGVNAINSPSTSPAVSTFRAVIEPLDCEMTLAAFPLTFDKLRGRVVLTPDILTIETLSGVHQDTSLSTSGRITWTDGHTHVEFAPLHVSNLALDDSLRAAVPWRLRRLWADLQPAGKCSLMLDPLVIDLQRDGQRTYLAAGTMELSDAAVALGGALTDVTGSIQGTAGFDKQFFIDAQLDLKRASINGRTLTDAKAALTRPADNPVFRLRNLICRFYEGTITGDMEINTATPVPRYGVSLTGEGISLSSFLNSKRRPDQPPVQAAGRVEGALSLSGRFGQSDTRQGRGTVTVHDAEMLKVPFILSILQIIHFATDDDNAFHNALFDFLVDGNELILERIDLRGKALSMVGAGRVAIPTQALDLVLLVGPPMRLPRVEVLSELMESVARELIEVRVGGTLEQPVVTPDIVRSVKHTLEAMSNVRRGEPSTPASTPAATK